MPTAIKETTVQELIQELQNFPNDAQVRLKDGEDLAYLIVGFQAGSECVTIILADDDSNEDDGDGEE
ncbi:hypothetical protein [Nostoc sp. 'Peltigera membranacea cyanobiont' 232]|uniref:hypothetical protein n=1 Tax=Nostoc sp. 'Peltigera membranacea cyanobiont' 232 TaxID=2014531 RepID=UPI000B95905B|nr:hypothetical protein [Nostoc sp. 'Peltigera membranacea cyanobiont' 232]OYE02950.1 hypothetical protein CDG79_21015 [Nostoc sp. 'Peltigera membranacea cyanobiont' 232]